LLRGGNLNIASFVVKSCTSVMEPHLVRMGLSERTVILPSFSKSRAKAENSVIIIVQYNACHGSTATVLRKTPSASVLIKLLFHY